jgi:hypothetical protein
MLYDIEIQKNVLLICPQQIPRLFISPPPPQFQKRSFLKINQSETRIAMFVKQIGMK